MGQIRGIWPKQLKYPIYPESGVFGYIPRRTGYLAHIPGYRPNTRYLAYILLKQAKYMGFRPVLAWNRPISSINTPKPPQNDPKWHLFAPFLASDLPAPFLRRVQKGGVFLTFDPCFGPSKNGPKKWLYAKYWTSGPFWQKGSKMGYPLFDRKWPFSRRKHPKMAYFGSKRSKIDLEIWPQNG